MDEAHPVISSVDTGFRAPAQCSSVGFVSSIGKGIDSITCEENVKHKGMIVGIARKENGRREHERRYSKVLHCSGRCESVNKHSSDSTASVTDDSRSVESEFCFDRHSNRQWNDEERHHRRTTSTSCSPNRYLCSDRRFLSRIRQTTYRDDSSSCDRSSSFASLFDS